MRSFYFLGLTPITMLQINAMMCGELALSFSCGRKSPRRVAAEWHVCVRACTIAAMQVWCGVVPLREEVKTNYEAGPAITFYLVSFYIKKKWELL